MELVEQDGGTGSVMGGRVAEWFPHIHYHQTNPAAFLATQPAIEPVHAGFRAVFASKPDGPPAQQIAHDDTVSMSLADRDFVDANDQRTGAPHPLYLRP